MLPKDRSNDLAFGETCAVSPPTYLCHCLTNPRPTFTCIYIYLCASLICPAYYNSVHLKVTWATCCMHLNIVPVHVFVHLPTPAFTLPIPDLLLHTYFIYLRPAGQLELSCIVQTHKSPELPLACIWVLPGSVFGHNALLLSKSLPLHLHCTFLQFLSVEVIMHEFNVDRHVGYDVLPYLLVVTVWLHLWWSGWLYDLCHCYFCSFHVSCITNHPENGETWHSNVLVTLVVVLVLIVLLFSAIALSSWSWSPRWYVDSGFVCQPTCPLGHYLTLMLSLALCSYMISEIKI